MTKSGPPRVTREVVLREVLDADLPVLFEHQSDPDASEMAAFPARDWDAFVAHWQKIRADDSATLRAILFDGQLAGNIVSFERDGEREVGYWIGKQYWGKGIATRALAEFLSVDVRRPLYAHVAKHNVGSVRVLEKCGFTISGENNENPDGIEEWILELRA